MIRYFTVEDELTTRVHLWCVNHRACLPANVRLILDMPRGRYTYSAKDFVLSLPSLCTTDMEYIEIYEIIKCGLLQAIENAVNKDTNMTTNMTTILPATQYFAYPDLQQDFADKLNQWREVSAEFYEEALYILPPIFVGDAFLVGEPYTHREGEEVSAAFIRVGNRYYARYSTETCLPKHVADLKTALSNPDLKFVYQISDFFHQSGGRYEDDRFNGITFEADKAAEAIGCVAIAYRFRALTAADIEKLFMGCSRVERVTQFIDLGSGWTVNITREPNYAENNV